MLLERDLTEVSLGLHQYKKVFKKRAILLEAFLSNNNTKQSFPF